MVFVTPARGTHGAMLLTGRLQLDYTLAPMEPCWISVVVHTPVVHLSDRGHFVSHFDIFADMFHLRTDVNSKEVQMETMALYSSY